MSLATRAVYPSQPTPLRQHLDVLLQGTEASDGEGILVGLIVPDSNRLSGGPASAQAYSRLRGIEVETVIVISPSHDGSFGRLSICQTDTYRTPLGDVAVNDHLRNELCDEDDDIYLDDTGHYHTEGADVQIPFLQVVLGDGFSVVPIVMGEESPAFCRELGAAVGEVMHGRRALVVGSCDLLHADAEGLARLREAVEAFDESALMHLLGSETVGIEGMGALITTLIATRRRGASRAEILSLTAPDADAPGTLAVALWR
ncbi:MAG: AmmeMemoRadiSam system protein B [Bacteroidota bacterium]